MYSLTDRSRQPSMYLPRHVLEHSLFLSDPYLNWPSVAIDSRQGPIPHGSRYAIAVFSASKAVPGKRQEDQFPPTTSRRIRQKGLRAIYPALRHPTVYAKGDNPYHGISTAFQNFSSSISPSRTLPVPISSLLSFSDHSIGLRGAD